MNPFYTTHDYIPFDKIAADDYLPAFEKGIKEEDEEIQSIISNQEVPTFQNTIEALEYTGQLLSRVRGVFFNLLSAETSDEMEALAEKVSPMLSQHSSDIILNRSLFLRIKAVYEDHKKDSFARLTTEQATLLRNRYRDFTNNGANLPEDKQDALRCLREQTSLLSLQFTQNILAETNAYTLHITNDAHLEGMPDTVREMGRHEAKQRGMEGHVYTLKGPSYVQFMKYCRNRELRQQMYMAYNTLCTGNGKTSNMHIVRDIVNKSREMARLLGFGTYAEYALQDRMAENPHNVYELLDDLLVAYMPKAKEEVAEIEQLYHTDCNIAADTLPADSPLRFQPWDFSYYANKLRQQKYDFDQEETRAYFPLANVKQGIFDLATRLYGITFHPNTQAPVYHPDVTVYDVIDKDGTNLALLYCDFHPRQSKKAGAWMTSFTDQYIDRDGINHRPAISIVTNISKPTDTVPSLLTLEEVETFLHEFGHALHGIFANTTYPSLSGTNVYWDFVELPSQFMENYSSERDFLNTFARHYQTGSSIPDTIIEKIIRSRNFNAAYACVRQVSFGLLDMAYYTLTTAIQGEIEDFEQEAWKKAQVMHHIPHTCMSTQFSHIMAGGYSAGYYSYKWAEVLDADAFSLFKQNGIFDPATAQSFRDNIISRGGTEHPMTLYTRFRGQKPTIEALLQRNGIKQ